jgi:hypothetical protein
MGILKCELTSITPPRRLAHIVINTLKNGRRKKEVVEKVIIGKKKKN